MKIDKINQKICEYCGKEYEKSNFGRFCSSICKSREYETRRPKRQYYLKCSYCHKFFYASRNRTKKEKLRFCCKKCGDNYRKEHSKEKECAICGKKFIPYRSNHNCCSRACKDKYMWLQEEKTCVVCGKKFYSPNVSTTCSEECYKTIKFENVYKNLRKGLYKSSMTAPHVIINDVLIDLGISFENEIRFGRKIIDIFIPNYEVCIEIMGTFWHLDSRFYCRDYDSAPTNGVIERDKEKRDKIENVYNKKILYLWEYDITNNIELCKQLILKFLLNPYNLESYHSSSYELQNNEIFYNENNKKQYLDL